MLAIILTIISVQGKIYTYSNPGLIFVYFWFFGISCLAFSILLSMFFSTSRSAVLIGIPVFIGSYFVSFAVSDSQLAMSRKAGASLLPTVAFSLATTVITTLETGQTGVTNDNLNFETENYTFGTYLWVIIIDIIYMGLLSMYLEYVWPTDWGVKRPWYFLVTKKFWCPRKIHTSESLFEQEINWGNAVEPVDESLESQKNAGRAMLVRDLSRHFANKVAVEKLNLNIYEGQIFALLGHNGAGKTTTISMLTGLIPRTDGDMTVNGLYLSKDLDKLRTIFGVCPQQNILFPDLTPIEHLYLFSVFKGINDNKRIDEMSNKVLSDLELLPQSNKLVKFLSGGQKRKLQLAIALIGDSKIVLLDEPTSGMDLTARRHMWDMLKNSKNGKIIILTTHYMEEADVLADRIAIMSDGKLRCCGSSLFLKNRYGVGYYLTMVKKQDAIKNSKKIIEFVTRYVTGANLMTDYHGEITFQLPNSSAHEFIKFFEDLDKGLDDLGLLSYSISATTLEEVFLRVARGDDETLKKQEENGEKEENSPLLQNNFVLIKDRIVGSLAFNHFLALTKKRIITTKRDVKTLLFEIGIPILLVLIGLCLMLVSQILTDYSAYDLVLSKYDSGQTLLFSGTADGSNFMNKIRDTNGTNIVNTGDASLQAFSDKVLNSRGVATYHLGAYFFNQIDTVNNIYNFSTFVNQTAYQSAPTFYHTMSNAVLQSIQPDFFMDVSNHPLPITQNLKSL